MTAGMHPAPLFLVPVRGGSKGIPRKNLRTVGGISLIGRSVRTARRAVDLLGRGRVVVDSDSPELMDEAKRWGAETPYVRPAELASDTASTLEVVRHAIKRLDLHRQADRALVLLQATSPLVTPEHVAECVRAFWSRRGRSVVSVAAPGTPPGWCYRLYDGQLLEPLFPDLADARRQDLPTTLALTGAVYVSSVGDLAEGRGFVPASETYGVVLERRHVVDVDDPSDFQVAEALNEAEPIRSVSVGRRALGPGHPCFVIAEAGVNHDGSVREAHRLVDAAADVGADAVKFQTWKTELLCTPGALTADYQMNNTGQSDQFTLLKGLELPYSAHPELKAHAEERGIFFLSTPDEIESARFLLDLGVPAIKIGSAEVDNVLYLSQLAGFGRPLLLSTGMADMNEVASAVDVIRAHGDPPLALFHTLSNYPAPVDQANVLAIATLRRAFHVPVGLSDHTLGPEAILCAAGIGVDLWEKHITIDRKRAGPDHTASLEPDEFSRQLTMLRSAEKARGDGVKRAQPSEMPTRTLVRKRLFALRDIAAGERLRADDIIALRGGDGLPASQWRIVEGQIARTRIARGAPIQAQELEGPGGAAVWGSGGE